MHPFEIDGRIYPLNQSKQVLPTLDLMGWLESNPLYPKVFWKDRNGQVTRAAVGNLFSFPHIPRFSESTPFGMRLYGGIRFSEKYHREDMTWRSFPKTCFWLPQIELSQTCEKTEAVFYSFNDGAQHFEAESPSLQLSKTSLINRLETPPFNVWKENVDTALKAIAAGELNKIVLARKTTLHFSKPLPVWSCLNHLMKKAKCTTIFAFQLSPSLCFLGATPERLFEREDELLSADVLAGTRPRGITAEEDAQYEQELWNSAKDQREFNIVKNFLQAAVSPLSTEMKWDGQDRILKVSYVQHIHNRLNAILKKEIFDETLIKAFHPTPALGGYPREKALALLRQIEPFDRGWYGGPIGVISPEGANLHVAIRSALIRECSLHLFAGTGIVQGSIAEREWEELEQKIRPFTELFL
jgi:menaquinone-specific isochorismate synthase